MLKKMPEHPTHEQHQAERRKTTEKGDGRAIPWLCRLGFHKRLLGGWGYDRCQRCGGILE